MNPTRSGLSYCQPSLRPITTISPDRSTFPRYLIYGLVFWYASGTLAHLLPTVLPVTRLTTDFFLFVLNGLVVYELYRRRGDRRLFVWIFVAYWFTFFTEAAGVATGAIFGAYAYGPTMWWQWLGVPFAIAFNWCVLTLACNEVAIRMLEKLFPVPNSVSAPGSHERVPEGELRTEPTAPPPPSGYPLPTIYYALTAAVLTALYDVVIEPVAIALDYWQWGGGEIPLQNYLAWAAIAFLISWPLYAFRIRFRSPVLVVYFWAQLFFFVVLNYAL